MSEDEARRAADLIERIGRLIQAEEQKSPLNPAQWEALRYLEKANRFSRTPAALAEYLGSTRGTVSQTLIALEKKGCVERRQSTRDRRSVDMTLTDAGRAQLAEDPLREFAAHIAATGTDGTLEEALSAVLHEAILQNRSKSFGICATCRFFRRDERAGDRTMPHRCALLDVPLSDDDSGRICAEQEPA
ncbi:MarR family winged helix-turn-helix transcriptional regulator [Chelativorans sp. M5D2P16]|uniref:MarR family winged helix-turn-helix transcriptional regulator n=1 Tax=Chelativorans sp. M5D2P16 TaxID=3095678 RepID=UPI002ACA73B8|nr:MarR family transcriptional regulator [Chelativorans sp. M5D2P16]MDZ5697464.1 MarR family transcriptional regulator [Chelativorans sp. M5D2P16]